MRKLFLFTFIIVVLTIISYGITEIIVRETELVKLDIQAKDPDKDNLTFSYSKPLDDKGEWQTGYGDEGVYNITVFVSDGVAKVSEKITLIVKRTEAEPEIKDFSPKEGKLIIAEGESINFKIEAIDLNKDPLLYTWSIDNKVISSKNTLSYRPNFEEAGQHTIKAEIGDGKSSIRKSWTLEVKDVDRSRLLDNILDVTANEGDSVKLNLPDFKKYDLQHSISDPIGNDNAWKTDFKDAGLYDVTVTIKNNNFIKTKSIKVKVLNIDREMAFKPIAPVEIYENQKVTINFQIIDPDTDNNVMISSPNLPKGAALNGFIFTWEPNFDAVVKEKSIDYFYDSFGLLKKTFLIKFIAKNRYQENVQIAEIVVKERNRPPVLEDMKKIIVNEGETVFLMPNYYDSDFDKVNVAYSGWTNGKEVKTGFNSAGDYKVTITASDGKLNSSKDVLIHVNNINREPVINDFMPQKVKENNELIVNISGYDPDKDILFFGSDNMPNSSFIRSNQFIWKPGFETLADGEKEFKIPIFISDNRSKVSKDLIVIVENTNRAPIITKKEPQGKIMVYVNEPVLFDIEATDPDNDQLYYNYKFGLFQNFASNNIHQRVFNSIGKKKVKVEVSDGLAKTSTIYNVEVLPNPLISKKVLLNETIEFSGENKAVNATKEIKITENKPVIIGKNVVEKQIEQRLSAIEPTIKKEQPKFYVFSIIELPPKVYTQEAPSIKLKTFYVNN